MARASVPTDIVDSLFAADLPEPAHWEARYGPRDLPSDALVTRFGPSPTGFVHVGGLYTAMISRDLAHATGGTFFVRIEDTDRVREVAGAREQFARAFAYLEIASDEDDETGAYGPYSQSQRGPIYETYVRELLREGRAYPCFCTREELAGRTAEQRRANLPTGYYGEWAPCRDLSPDEVVERLQRGDPYAVRFRSPGQAGIRVTFADAIRGEIEQDDNRNDAVILKSSAEPLRLPTYHFAHAVDDHLMRVNLVVRAEEWISSVPLHLQLFAALEFDPIDYAHVAPLMKTEGSSRRKLSKRKDPEASVDFYLATGYPSRAVVHYLRGLANSRLADMDFEEAAREPLRLDEMGVAGPLVDLAKLESVSRNWIATLFAEEVYWEVLAWARNHDAELADVLVRERDVAVRSLAVEREGAENPRKDLAKWSEFRDAYSFFFAELFEPVPADDARFAPVDTATVRALAADFAARYEHDADPDTWFAQIRAVAAAHSFAATVGEYKADPERYVGSVREAANVIRVAVTGRTKSPDLYEISRVLGRDELLRRVRLVAEC